MKKFNIYLTGLSVSLLLLSLNRLTSWTHGYLPPHDFLRWLDFNAMLPISLLYVLFFWLLKDEVVKAGKPVLGKSLFILNLIIIVGIYIYGASSGVHEPMNYLNHRFCSDGRNISQICQIVNTNDEPFSHTLFYLAAIILSLSLGVIEFISPRIAAATKGEMGWVTGNALFIALGIFANLAHDVAPIPMTAFSIIAIGALVLLSLRGWRIKDLPITYYLALSYALGVVSVVAYKLFA